MGILRRLVAPLAALLALVVAGEVTDLASLAADLGWFDQAHFSRDFRSTVGVTPSEYLAQAASPAG